MKNAQEKKEQSEKDLADSVGEKHDSELASITKTWKIDALGPDTQKSIQTEFIRSALKTNTLWKDILIEAQKGIKDFDTLDAEGKEAALLNSDIVQVNIAKTLEQFKKSEEESRTKDLQTVDAHFNHVFKSLNKNTLIKSI